jgi:hypothetical protein
VQQERGGADDTLVIVYFTFCDFSWVLSSLEKLTPALRGHRVWRPAPMPCSMIFAEWYSLIRSFLTFYERTTEPCGKGTATARSS